ncbi:unnamed protein product [Ilex paraguariensis]|uniref:FLZ-type domain-containing protein n=1 Tax=Ilex paraguariensis TaxID=185542 RepID=A0ABC8QT21_9AQUA
MTLKIEPHEWVPVFDDVDCFVSRTNCGLWGPTLIVVYGLWDLLILKYMGVVGPCLLRLQGSEELHHQPHFLEACFLCQRPLGQNSDIFMYRGNAPFCSQECRQEQIEIDEAQEKRWKLSSSKISKTIRKTADSPKESGNNKAVQTGTVAVA